jgi:hypothetical protein
MSKKTKLSERFKSIPSDFTWEELVAVLSYFGYEETGTGKTSGSRKRFADNAGNLILLHKPHPANVVKKYALRQVLETLKERGQIGDD